MADRPKVVIDPSCIGHPNLQEAALAALLRVPRGKQEQAGVLFVDSQGKFCYSTLAPGDADSFDLKAEIPEGSKFAGIYHNHPEGRLKDGDSRLFSANDISIANNLKVPSFVRSEKDGNVRSFTPGQTKVNTGRRAGKLTESSKGDLVVQSAIADALRADISNAE